MGVDGHRAKRHDRAGDQRTLVGLGSGSANSSTDSDDYYRIVGDDADFEAWLDVDPALTPTMTLVNGSGTVLATGAGGVSSHGDYLSYSMSSGTTYYLRIHTNSGSGRYHAELRGLLPIPALTSLSAYSGSVGTSITISGTDLGTSTSDVTVSFGGVEAEVTAATGTTLTAKVPQNAPDGDVVICRAGGCSGGLSFTTGGSMAASTWTRPATGDWLFTSGVGGVFMTRILVSLTPASTSSDAASIISTATASVTDLATATQSGFIPFRNDYQYTLTWAVGSDVNDYKALVNALLSDSRVDGVLPEGRADFYTTPALEKSDVGFQMSAVQDEEAAYDVIGMEETWRLLSTCCSGGGLGGVTVDVLDTGLRNNTAPEGAVQFKPGYLTYFERDANNEYAPTTSPRDATLTNPSHGTMVASIIAAWDDNIPPWNGTAVATRGGMGILAGVNEWGVDDDGDSSLDANDTSGETFPWELRFFNGTVATGTGTGGLAGTDIYQALSDYVDYCRANAAFPDVLNLSIGMSALPTGLSSSSLERLLASIPASTLVVAASGNASIGAGPQTVDARNYLAKTIDTDVQTHLIVASSDPGGLTSTSDDSPQNVVDGAQVNLVAPGTVRVLKDHISPNTTTWGTEQGASYAAPLVSSVAALVMAVDATPSGSSAAFTPQDARTLVLEHAMPVPSSLWGGTSHYRLDAFGAVLAAIESGDLLDKTPYVFVADYYTNKLWRQEVDPSTGAFVGASADSVTITDCTSPSGTEVDPRGDLVYVLCTGSNSFAVLNATTLDVVASVPLAGTVTSESELAVSPDGLVVVTSVYGSDAVTEVWDPYIGGMDASLTTIAGSVGVVVGASADPTSPLIAIATTDGNNTNKTGEKVGILTLDAYSRTTSANAVSVVTNSLSTPVVDHIRDVEWNVTDGSLDSVFYEGVAGNDETCELNDAGTVTDYGNVDTINALSSISTNPSEEDSFAYVADHGTQYLAMIDVNEVSDWTPAAFYSPPSAGYDPRIVEFGQNGKFVVVGYAGGTSAGLFVYVMPHDPGAYGTTAISSVADVLSGNTYKPRGIAVSPLMSILSPRPGKELSGRRRVEVLIRDPEVTSVSYTIDGAADSTNCPIDTVVVDGISDSCVLDPRANSWVDSADHVLRATAHYPDGSTFFVEGRY